VEELRFVPLYRNLVGGECFLCGGLVQCMRHTGDIRSPFVFVLPRSTLCLHGDGTAASKRFVLGSVFDMYLRALRLSRGSILFTSEEFLPVYGGKDGNSCCGKFQRVYEGRGLGNKVFFLFSVKQFAKFFGFSPIGLAKERMSIYPVEGGSCAVYLPSPAFITRRGSACMDRVLLQMMEYAGSEEYKSYGK